MPASYDRNGVPIDRSALAAIVHGNTAAERRLLRTFREANTADLARLASACEQRNGEAVMRAIHRILGAGRVAGATALCQVCEAMAQAGKAGDWQALGAHQSALEQELARINAYIDTELAGRS